MKKLILLTGLLAFLLFSCDGLLGGNGDTDGPGGGKDPIDEDGVVKKNFKAQSFKNGSFYSLSAGKLAEGTYCTVWVERGAGITKATAEKVMKEFDSNVYTKMINTFGANNSGFSFAAELADINSAEDGKLLILLLDIRDDYQKGVNESAVGGYFLWSDLFPSEPDSNGLAMIYIDTNPGVPGEAASNKTLAHEMQHLMNEVTSQVLRQNSEGYSVMDTWIDEGLSAAAEYVYSGTHSSDRVNWYNYRNTDPKIKSLINEGNNFFVWGNRDGTGANQSIYAEQDDYATAYLFFQWLRIQSSKGAGIYKDIIGSDKAGYLAVTTAFGGSWGDILRDWLAANYINDTTTSGTNSRYGYKNDATLRNINKHYFAGTGTTVSLYPGEGVFSNIDADYVNKNSSKPTDGTNIKYTILTTAPGNTIAEGALLTYNANPLNVVGDNFPSPENGTVTGGASISVDLSVDGRFVSPPVVLSGPFWVSGGDVLRRNGMTGSLPPAGVSRPSIRIAK